MRKIALLTAALALPTQAWALGVGTTGYLGGDFGIAGGAFGFSFGGFWLPSLDLYFGEKVVVQLHALDLLAWLIEDGDILLGGDVVFTALEVPALGETEAVIQPGGTLDIYSFGGDVGIVFGGLARIGIEGGNDARVGLYVVPGLGVAAGDFDEDVVWSGGMQLSIWFGGVGGGAGGGGSAPPPNY